MVYTHTHTHHMHTHTHTHRTHTHTPHAHTGPSVFCHAAKRPHVESAGKAKERPKHDGGGSKPGLSVAASNTHFLSGNFGRKMESFNSLGLIADLSV